MLRESRSQFHLRTRLSLDKTPDRAPGLLEYRDVSPLVLADGPFFLARQPQRVGFQQQCLRLDVSRGIANGGLEQNASRIGQGVDAVVQVLLPLDVKVSGFGHASSCWTATAVCS